MKETDPEDNNLCGCFRIRIRFTECLLKFWRDLQDDQIWKYEELSPLEFLGRSEQHSHTVVEDELTRAQWFWSRRPRVLSIASWIVWFVAAIGAPFWILAWALIGVPLLIAALTMVPIEIVRSVRWRRDYESSIDRLIRASKNGKDAFGCDVLS